MTRDKDRTAKNIAPFGRSLRALDCWLIARANRTFLFWLVCYENPVRYVARARVNPRLEGEIVGRSAPAVINSFGYCLRMFSVLGQTL